MNKATHSISTTTPATPTAAAIAWVEAMVGDGFSFRLIAGGDAANPNDFVAFRGGPDSSAAMIAALRARHGAGRPESPNRLGRRGFLAALPVVAGVALATPAAVAMAPSPVPTVADLPPAIAEAVRDFQLCYRIVQDRYELVRSTGAAPGSAIAADYAKARADLRTAHADLVRTLTELLAADLAAQAGRKGGVNAA